MDTDREKKLKKEVDLMLPLVSEFIESEKTSAAAAFIIGGNICATACLSLDISLSDFKIAMEGLVMDYEVLLKVKNDRKD